MTTFKQHQDQGAWPIKMIVRVKLSHSYVQCVFNVDGTYTRKEINQKNTEYQLTERAPYSLHAFSETIISEAEFRNRFVNWLSVHQQNYAIDTRSKIEEFANLDNLGDF